MYLGLYQHAAAYVARSHAKWTDPAWEPPIRALSGRTNAIVTIRMVHAAGYVERRRLARQRLLSTRGAWWVPAL